MSVGWGFGQWCFSRDEALVREVVLGQVIIFSVPRVRYRTSASVARGHASDGRKSDVSHIVESEGTLGSLCIAICISIMHPILQLSNLFLLSSVLFYAECLCCAIFITLESRFTTHRRQYPPSLVIPIACHNRPIPYDPVYHRRRIVIKTRLHNEIERSFSLRGLASESGLIGLPRAPSDSGGALAQTVRMEALRQPSSPLAPLPIISSWFCYHRASSPYFVFLRLS